jgi:hypothetical protein
MMQLKAPIASDSTHWYSKTGVPTYEVTAKNGNLRKATLADARKMGLFPGVTSILKVKAAPQLTEWLINQAIDSALTLPTIEGESADDRKKRIKRDAKEQAEKARDKGTLIHGAIEKYLNNERVGNDYLPYVTAAMDAAFEWASVTQWESEKAFAHWSGYGGKCDLHAKVGDGWVIDFKSKDFTEDNLPGTWDEHAMQLSAYREGFSIPNARCAIVFVSTRVPGLVHLVEIPEDDLNRGWLMFDCCLKLWKLDKRFDPTTVMQ